MATPALPETLGDSSSSLSLAPGLPSVGLSTSLVKTRTFHELLPK